MIWTAEHEQVINSHLNVFSEATHTFYCWAPKSLDTQAFFAAVSQSPLRECYFSVSLVRANIFFRSEFLDLDTGGLQFRIPNKVFKVQRRNDVRLPILENFAMKVSFKDPLFPLQEMNKKVLDISAGGLAFMITEDESAIFPKGLILKDVTFMIGNRKLTTRAEISNVRELRDDRNKGYHAVGIHFLDLRPGDAQYIAGYVFEESRKYFMRFI